VENLWRSDGPREGKACGVRRNALHPKRSEMIGPFLRQRFSTLPPKRGKGVGKGATNREFTLKANSFGDVS